MTPPHDRRIAEVLDYWVGLDADPWAIAPARMKLWFGKSAETDAEARYLFTSQQQSFVNLRSGQPGPLPPPRDLMSS